LATLLQDQEKSLLHRGDFFYAGMGVFDGEIMTGHLLNKRSEKVLRAAFLQLALDFLKLAL